MKAESGKWKPEDRALLTPKVESKEDADFILQTIGRIEDRIRAIEIRERAVIRQANDRAVTEAGPLIAQRELLVKAVEKWAKRMKDGSEIFSKSRTLDLNFGSIGFRWTHWKIKYLVKAETIIERLCEAGMSKCIRVRESVNREKILALNYENDKLEPLGMLKSRKEKFFYEVKPEVK